MKKEHILAIFLLIGCIVSVNAYGYNLLSGGEITLKELLAASPREIFFFYSTRCPYCSQEIQLLNDNCSYLEKKGYKIFFIALPESKRHLNRHKELLHLKCPIVIDDGSLTDLYGIFGVPTYIFLYKGKPFGMANSMELQEIKDVFNEEGKNHWCSH